MSGIVGANFLKESGLKRSHKFQRFTADGTWVKPSGITTVYIEVISSGYGGGGARGNSGARHGGGGGGAIPSNPRQSQSIQSSPIPPNPVL